MKASELREMQEQYMRGEAPEQIRRREARAQAANTPTMATSRQIDFLTDLVARHPDHANTMGIHADTDLTTLTRTAASDAISYILNERG